MWRSRFKNKGLIIFFCRFYLEFQAKVLIVCYCSTPWCAWSLYQRQLQRSQEQHVVCVSLCDVGSGREENGPALASRVTVWVGVCWVQAAEATQ
jgi:hypothetical protein